RQWSGRLECAITLDRLHAQRVGQVEASAPSGVYSEILAPSLVSSLEGHPQAALAVKYRRTARLEIGAGGHRDRLLHFDRFAEAHQARVDVVVALIVGIPCDRNLTTRPGGDGRIPVAGR